MRSQFLPIMVRSLSLSLFFTDLVFGLIACCSLLLLSLAASPPLIFNSPFAAQLSVMCSPQYSGTVSYGPGPTSFHGVLSGYGRK